MSAPVANFDSPEIEKADVQHLERTISEESDSLYDARIAALTPEEQKKVMRRIDIRLVLTLGFMYCVSLMDRTNTVSHCLVCNRPSSDMYRALPLSLEWVSTSNSSESDIPS